MLQQSQRSFSGRPNGVMLTDIIVCQSIRTLLSHDLITCREDGLPLSNTVSCATQRKLNEWATLSSYRRDISVSWAWIAGNTR